MKAQTHYSPAELADRSLQFVAYAMFAVALVFVLSVAEFFASEPVAAVLDVAVKIMAVAILALMAFVVFGKLKSMSPSQRRQYIAEDGFLQIGFQKAMANSWMWSFLVLVMLQVLDNLVLARLPEMPLDIVIKMVLALMLLLFSGSYLFVTRSSRVDE